MSKTTKKMRDFFFLQSFLNFFKDKTDDDIITLSFKKSGTPGKTEIKDKDKEILFKGKTEDLTLETGDPDSHVVHISSDNNLPEKVNQNEEIEVEIKNSAGKITAYPKEVYSEDKDICLLISFPKEK